jgi:hypothetical protein
MTQRISFWPFLSLLLFSSIGYGQIKKHLIQSSADVPMQESWQPQHPVYPPTENHIPAENFWENPDNPAFFLHLGAFWRQASTSDSTCIYINDSNFRTVAFQPGGRGHNKIIIKDTLTTIYCLEETVDYLKNRLEGRNEETEIFAAVILLLNKDGSIKNKKAIIAALKKADYYFK